MKYYKITYEVIGGKVIDYVGMQATTISNAIIKIELL